MTESFTNIEKIDSQVSRLFIERLESEPWF